MAMGGGHEVTSTQLKHAASGTHHDGELCVELCYHTYALCALPCHTPPLPGGAMLQGGRRHTFDGGGLMQYHTTVLNIMFERLHLQHGPTACKPLFGRRLIGLSRLGCRHAPWKAELNFTLII